MGRALLFFGLVVSFWTAPGAWAKKSASEEISSVQAFIQEEKKLIENELQKLRGFDGQASKVDRLGKYLEMLEKKEKSLKRLSPKYSQGSKSAFRKQDSNTFRQIVEDLDVKTKQFIESYGSVEGASARSSLLPLLPPPPVGAGRAVVRSPGLLSPLPPLPPSPGVLDGPGGCFDGFSGEEGGGLGGTAEGTGVTRGEKENALTALLLSLPPMKTETEKTQEAEYKLFRSHCGQRGGFFHLFERRPLYSYLKHQTEACLKKFKDDSFDVGNIILRYKILKNLFFANEKKCQATPSNECFLNQAYLLDFIDQWRKRDPRIPPLSASPAQTKDTGLVLNDSVLNSNRTKCQQRRDSKKGKDELGESSCMAGILLSLLKDEPLSNLFISKDAQGNSVYQGPQAFFGKSLHEYSSFGEWVDRRNFFQNPPRSAQGEVKIVRSVLSDQSPRNISFEKHSMVWVRHPLNQRFLAHLPGIQPMEKEEVKSNFPNTFKELTFISEGTYLEKGKSGKQFRFLKHPGGGFSVHTFHTLNTSGGKEPPQVTSYYLSSEWVPVVRAKPSSSGSQMEIEWRQTEKFASGHLVSLWQENKNQVSFENFMKVNVQGYITGLEKNDPQEAQSLAQFRTLYLKPDVQKTPQEQAMIQNFKRLMD